MVASDEITGLVKDYMEGGDQDGFGQNDPWALLVASGGGLCRGNRTSPTKLATDYLLHSSK